MFNFAKILGIFCVVVAVRIRAPAAERRLWNAKMLKSLGLKSPGTPADAIDTLQEQVVEPFLWTTSDGDEIISIMSSGHYNVVFRDGGGPPYSEIGISRNGTLLYSNNTEPSYYERAQNAIKKMKRETS